LRRCLAIPLRGFGRILRAADTILIHAAKPKLAPGFPLLGRCPVPFQRLAIVLGNTLPLLVHAAKAKLAPGVALLGGFAVPLYGFGIIPLYASAPAVRVGE